MDYSSTTTFDFTDDDDDEYSINDDTPDSDNEVNADTGDPCTICSGRLIKTGLHMATRLKCGHQFGYRCISGWLKRANNYCPTCKCVSYTRHMRGVYQRIENRWDRTPTEEDLRAMEGKRLQQAGRGAQRRAQRRGQQQAMRRLDRQAREADVTESQSDDGDDLETAASRSQTPVS